MSEFFNKEDADAEVIKSLLKEIRRLQPMALFKLEDGRVIRTNDYSEVTREELEQDLAKLREEQKELSSFLSPEPVAEEPAPTPEPTPEPQAEPVQEQPTEPTPTEEQPAPVVEAPTPEPTPEEAPAAEPTQPEQPQITVIQ